MKRKMKDKEFSLYLYATYSVLDFRVEVWTLGTHVCIQTYTDIQKRMEANVQLEGCLFRD